MVTNEERQQLLQAAEDYAQRVDFYEKRFNETGERPDKPSAGQQRFALEVFEKTGSNRAADALARQIILNKQGQGDREFRKQQLFEKNRELPQDLQNITITEIKGTKPDQALPSGIKEVRQPTSTASEVKQSSPDPRAVEAFNLNKKSNLVFTNYGTFNQTPTRVVAESSVETVPLTDFFTPKKVRVDLFSPTGFSRPSGDEEKPQQARVEKADVQDLKGFFTKVVTPDQNREEFSLSKPFKPRSSGVIDFINALDVESDKLQSQKFTGSTRDRLIAEAGQFGIGVAEGLAYTVLPFTRPDIFGGAIVETVKNPLAVGSAFGELIRDKPAQFLGNLAADKAVQSGPKVKNVLIEGIEKLNVNNPTNLGIQRASSKAGEVLGFDLEVRPVNSIERASIEVTEKGITNRKVIDVINFGEKEKFIDPKLNNPTVTLTGEGKTQITPKLRPSTERTVDLTKPQTVSKKEVVVYTGIEPYKAGTQLEYNYPIRRFAEPESFQNYIDTTTVDFKDPNIKGTVNKVVDRIDDGSSRILKGELVIKTPNTPDRIRVNKEILFPELQERIDLRLTAEQPTIYDRLTDQKTTVNFNDIKFKKPDTVSGNTFSIKTIGFERQEVFNFNKGQARRLTVFSGLNPTYSFTSKEAVNGFTVLKVFKSTPYRTVKDTVVLQSNVFRPETSQEGTAQSSKGSKKKGVEVSNEETGLVLKPLLKNPSQQQKTVVIDFTKTQQKTKTATLSRQESKQKQETFTKQELKITPENKKQRFQSKERQQDTAVIQFTELKTDQEQKIKTLQRFKTGTLAKTATQQARVSITGVLPAQQQAQQPKQATIPAQRLRFDQLRDQAQERILQPDTINIPKLDTPTRITRKIIEERIKVDTPQFNPPGGSSRSTSSPSRKTKGLTSIFTPSLTAATFNIKRKKQRKKNLSGLELRGL